MPTFLKWAKAKFGIGAGTGEGHQPPILDIFPELKKKLLHGVSQKSIFQKFKGVDRPEWSRMVQAVINYPERSGISDTRNTTNTSNSSDAS